MTTTRTPEQKAAHAARERARYAAKKTEAAAAAETVEPTVDLSTMPDLDLYREAKAEHQAGLTEADGPHLAELHARKAAGRRVTARVKTTSTRSVRHPLVAEAIAARDAASNKRGAGRKAEDGELVRLASEYRSAGLTVSQGLNVAYWVVGLKVTHSSWGSAWDTTATVENGAAV